MSTLTPGEGTPARKLKKLWQKARTGAGLRAFVHSLLEEGGEFALDAKRWFDSKHGKLKASRLDKNVSMSKLMAAATKATKSKKK